MARFSNKSHRLDKKYKVIIKKNTKNKRNVQLQHMNAPPAQAYLKYVKILLGWMEHNRRKRKTNLPNVSCHLIFHSFLVVHMIKVILWLLR